MGIGVLAEVLLFLLMSLLMHKFGAERLFVLALGLTALRWLVLGEFVQTLPLLIFWRNYYMLLLMVYFMPRRFI